MTEIQFEALCNEVDFLQKEVERLQEQNKTLVNLIIKMRKDEKD